MFEVPGWAISQSSLVQERPTARKTESHPASGALPASTTKKRKSALLHHDQASKVSGSDLEKLWNQRTGLKRARAPEAVQQKVKKAAEHGNRVEIKGDQSNIVQEGKKRVRQKKKDKSRQSSGRGEDEDSKNGIRTIDDGGDKPSSSTAPTKDILKTLPTAPAPTNLTPLQAKMRNKLTSARFRHLNETLYTTSSAAAMDLFTTSPDLFAEYHAGFSQQVKDSWPVNPVQQYVTAIKSRGQLSLNGEEKSGAMTSSQQQTSSLPRRKTGSCTIADLGCGDAPLARGCQSLVKTLKLKFHNFDLHASNSHVTKADISSLPLRDGEADIAVFCLSLMGTNWLAFVEEAWRILRGDGKGEVWISEVKSRFGRVNRHRQPGHVVENSVGKKRKNPKSNNAGEEPLANLLDEEPLGESSDPADETDISAFVAVFSKRGFVLRNDSVDKSNKMFVSMIFTKSGVPSAGKYKGFKWTGKEYQKVSLDGSGGPGAGKTRFVDKRPRQADEDITPEEEAKVLKPCVYKTR